MYFPYDSKLKETDDSNNIRNIVMRGVAIFVIAMIVMVFIYSAITQNVEQTDATKLIHAPSPEEICEIINTQYCGNLFQGKVTVHRRTNEKEAHSEDGLEEAIYEIVYTNTEKEFIFTGRYLSSQELQLDVENMLVQYYLGRNKDWELRTREKFDKKEGMRYSILIDIEDEEDKAEFLANLRMAFEELQNEELLQNRDSTYKLSIYTTGPSDFHGIVTISISKINYEEVLQELENDLMSNTKDKSQS